MAMMWIFYSDVHDDAKGFYSKNGMILNVLALSYFAGVWVTISLCESEKIENCKVDLNSPKFISLQFLLGEIDSAKSMMKDYIPGQHYYLPMNVFRCHFP